MMPMVSVIIPAYNHAQYIRQCVDSVLSQTYQDFEIVVVDDGSSDGTVEILREYGNQIVLLEQVNQGTQAARNVAIKASSGEYIALLDSDDYWLPTKLERQIAVFSLEPEVALVYALAYIVQSDTLNLNAIAGQVIDEAEPPFEKLLIANRIPALTAVIRKDRLAATGLFDESLFGAADWDLWLRITAQWPIRCVKEPLACYRIHELNTTKALYKSRAIHEEHRQVLDKMRSMFPDRVNANTVWQKASARLHILGAEVEMLAGNSSEAVEEIARAFELAPDLPIDFEELAQMMARWTLQSCRDDQSGKALRQSVDDLFLRIATPSRATRSLKRNVLAIAAMTRAFESFGSGDLSTVRATLPTGVTAEPRWLFNTGVWSIGFRAFASFVARTE